MSCLGVHFALTDEEVKVLRSFADEQERLEHVQEVIEQRYLTADKAFAAESDKAWEAMHRALTDGNLSWKGGPYPLNHVGLAGEVLYTGSDYIMTLKTPRQVEDIAAALPGVTEQEFRRRYFTIDAAGYGSPVSEEDFGYTWEWFQAVREFYQRAATSHRYVLFTADQ